MNESHDLIQNGQSISLYKKFEAPDYASENLFHYTLLDYRRSLNGAHLQGYFIRDRIIQDGLFKFSWFDLTFFQEHGTCAAYAVCMALAYEHRVGKLLANYLYQNAWEKGKTISFPQDKEKKLEAYNQGVTIKNAMHAARDDGTWELPQGKYMQFGTGGPFPYGDTLYKFTDIYDLGVYVKNWHEDLLTFFGFKVSKSDPASIIQKGLIDFGRPIVVAGISSKPGHDTLFKRYLKPLDAEPGPIQVKEEKPLDAAPGPIKDKEEKSPGDRKIRHAFLIFGFNEKNQEFYVKNSWGETAGENAWALAQEGLEPALGGNAKISYYYINQYIDEYWVGFSNQIQ
jgi:hypothetical protein